MAIPECAKVVPPLVEVSPGQFSACIRTAPPPGSFVPVSTL
jgi:hypothetical protein